MPDATLDKVTIWIQAFIPMAIVDALGTCFSGDDRGFSSDYNEARYRARSEISVTGFLSGAPEWIEFHSIGETHRVDCGTGDVLEVGTAPSDGMTFHDFQVGNTYPDPEGGVVDLPNQETAGFLYDGVTHNPLVVPSPDIDIAIFFWVDPVGRTLFFRGATNAFPDYEAYASADDGAAATLFQRPHSMDPAGGLPGGADQPVSGTVEL